MGLNPTALRKRSSRRDAFLADLPLTMRLPFCPIRSLLRLVWPENDASEVERWRFTLRVMATTSPRNSSEKSLPLKELFAKIILFWDRARNEFAVKRESD
jgi:hypothetical protein